MGCRKASLHYYLSTGNLFMLNVSTNDFTINNPKKTNSPIQAISLFSIKKEGGFFIF